MQKFSRRASTRRRPKNRHELANLAAPEIDRLCDDFREKFERAAERQASSRGKSTIDEADVMDAWRSFFGNKVPPLWQQALSDFAVFLAGALLAYGLGLVAIEATKGAGIAVIVAAFAVAGMAVVLKYFRAK